MKAIDIGRERSGDAVDILCAAFHDYPVMRFVIGESDPEYDGKIRDLISFFVASRLNRDVPLLALEEAGRLHAVAVVSPPDDVPMPAELASRFGRLEARLGAEAMARFETYDQACEATDPGHAAHYLGMIATRPDRQRAGLGRAMMTAVKDRARAHPGSTGITLNTEQSANLAFYEKVGFTLVGEADAGTLHTWSFYWPCER